MPNTTATPTTPSLPTTSPTNFETACNEALRRSFLTLLACLSVNLGGLGETRDRYPSKVEVDDPSAIGWYQDVMIYVDDIVEQPASVLSPPLADTVAKLVEQAKEENTTTSVILRPDVLLSAKRGEGFVTFGLALMITASLRHNGSQ